MEKTGNGHSQPPRNLVVNLLHKLEDTLLVMLLLTMVLLSVLQILLRNVMDAGLLWSDALVRILVLWIGLLGAMVASRKGEHICIDLVTRYLSDRFKNAIATVVNLFTAFVCAVVAWHSLTLLRFEFQDGTIAFGAVPVWVCELIIPVGFAVIALRYLLQTWESLKKLTGAEP